MIALKALMAAFSGGAGGVVPLGGGAFSGGNMFQQGILQA